MPSTRDIFAASVVGACIVLTGIVIALSAAGAI
jgi:hypothetical protein